MLKHNLLLRVIERPCWHTAGSFWAKQLKEKAIIYGKLPVTQLMKSIDSAINLKQILNTKMQEGLNGHMFSLTRHTHIYIYISV